MINDKISIIVSTLYKLDFELEELIQRRKIYVKLLGIRNYKWELFSYCITVYYILKKKVI